MDGHIRHEQRLTVDINDQSEFPSLSGAPQQAQPQNPSHAVWGQRSTQQTTAQRQQQVVSQAQSAAPQSTQAQSRQSSQTSSHDDVFPSSAQFSSGLDEFRQGSQGIGGQMSAGSQPQTGSIDEFPPLGRNISEDLSQERRGSIMQSAGFGGYGGSLGFGGGNMAQAQARNGMSNPINGQQEGNRISSQTVPGIGGILPLSEEI
jgi:CCR4-NOT transcription complex subunit 2